MLLQISQTGTLKVRIRVAYCVYIIMCIVLDQHAKGTWPKPVLCSFGHVVGKGSNRSHRLGVKGQNEMQWSKLLLLLLA